MTFEEWYVSANPNHSPRDELLKLAMAAGWHAGRAELTREQMEADKPNAAADPR